MGFFDAQNLSRHAKDAFGHFHPNFDPKKLHAAVCVANGWTPNLTRFYPRCAGKGSRRNVGGILEQPYPGA